MDWQEVMGSWDWKWRIMRIQYICAFCGSCDTCPAMAILSITEQEHNT